MDSSGESIRETWVKPVSVAMQLGLCQTWSETLKKIIYCFNYLTRIPNSPKATSRFPHSVR